MNNPSERERAQKTNTGGSEIQISADEATNTLLIFAPADTFETLDQIILELDAPRMQVYVEALVMEVTLAKVLTLELTGKQLEQQITTGFSAEDSQGRTFDTASAAAIGHL